MNAEHRGDLKFSGNMTTPGGMYKRVNINGNVTFDGSMDCLDFKVNGVVTVTRDLKAENAHANGSLSVNGNAGGGNLDTNGHCRVDGNVAFGTVKSLGRLDVRGDVTADKLEASGQLDVRGKCDAEAFVCKGTFEIEGTLNADEMTVNLYGPSRVKEMVGSKITVRKAKGDALSKFFVAITGALDMYRARLTADTIEGDAVDIEYATARVIRGRDVKIGDDCEIDLVEYRGTFEKTPGASVLKHIKI